jgi:hypothetical protein
MENGFSGGEPMGKDFWANILLCLVLAVFAIFAVTRIGSALTPKGLLVGEPRPSAESAPLLKDVRIAQYRIIMDRGHKVAAHFYIRNDSARDVKNVSILCDFFDGKGNFMDREKWILSHTFPAGEERKSSSVLENFVNMNGTSDCRVADLQVAETGIPDSGTHGSAAVQAESGSGEKGHGAPQGGGH